MKFKRAFSAITVLFLIFSLILCGCGNNTAHPEASTEIESVEPGEDGYKYHFTLEVVDADGNQRLIDYATNREILGDVLQERGFVKGEQGDYGLYIKEVNGIVADYSTTGTYWAFYIDGVMATTGVDQTKIVDGATYSLKIEK
ncbi:MAG: DUF4430 domain-containing protein [Clostridia bacterium]|nr:DUF4430 domain-containing protein [Clostridia bacterium]